MSVVDTFIKQWQTIERVVVAAAEKDCIYGIAAGVEFPPDPVRWYYLIGDSVLLSFPLSVVKRRKCAFFGHLEHHDTFSLQDSPIVDICPLTEKSNAKKFLG